MSWSSSDYLDKAASYAENAATNARAADYAVALKQLQEARRLLDDAERHIHQEIRYKQEVEYGYE